MVYFEKIALSPDKVFNTFRRAARNNTATIDRLNKYIEHADRWGKNQGSINAVRKFHHSPMNVDNEYFYNSISKHDVLRKLIKSIKKRDSIKRLENKQLPYLTWDKKIDNSYVMETFGGRPDITFNKWSPPILAHELGHYLNGDTISMHKKNILVAEALATRKGLKIIKDVYPNAKLKHSREMLNSALDSYKTYNIKKRMLDYTNLRS